MKHPSMLRELNNLKGETLIVKKIKIQIKDNLERIKKSFKNKDLDENDVEKIVEEMHSLPLPFSGEVKFQIDAQGIMKSNASELVEAIFFSEKDVEILRIRKCLICEKIYWAERFESFACNSICGNKLRESVKVKVVRNQEEKDAAAKRKREYNLMRKVRKLTKQYKGKVIRTQKSAFFDSAESDDSFKLAKGTTVTITKFDSNEKSENYPIRCIVRSEEGQEVFFTLPNDKKTPFRIKLKLGAN
jgi:CRISPR/Cas system-associated endoribonuclease Cas2